MAKVLAALFLLSLHASGVVGLTVKPKETAKAKLDHLVKMADAVSWHKNVTHIVPAHIKEKVRIARMAKVKGVHARQIPAHQMLGECGSHIPVKQLGLVTASKSIALLGLGMSSNLTSPDWEVTSGSGCSIEGNCAESGSHPEIYSNHQSCTITINTPRPLEVVRFETEGYFDQLTVNDQVYTGRGITAGPEGVMPSGVIQWSSDFSVLYGGWKICLEQPQEHEGTNSYAMPGVGANQVVADNGNDAMGIVNGDEPFVKVLKDGFFEVGCYFDKMLTSADKFGNDKDKYNNQQNVSVAKYNELVLKMEQKEVTPTICFQFCRTIRGMVFFGIANGNECYCAPYFHAGPGDDSKCDVGCQGDPTKMCGNAKGKSTIWEMHLCGDTGDDLQDNTIAADEALTYFYESAAYAVDLGSKMSDAGAALEKVGGLSGSMVAAGLGMEANKASADLTRSWMTGRKPYESLFEAAKKAQSLEGEDFTVATTVTQVENTITIIKEFEPTVYQNGKDIHELVKRAYPASQYQAFGGDELVDSLAKELRSGAKAHDFRLASYAMGQRELEPPASLCSGKTIGLPKLGLGENGCGIACEQTLFPTKCLGFTHFQVDGTEDVCFLFSEMDDVEIFDDPEEGKSLLQQKSSEGARAAAVCKVKLTEIRLGYKPKGELKKKTRCFGSCDGLSAREGVANYAVPSSVMVGGKSVIEKP